jgi:hypothetical protein
MCSLRTLSASSFCSGAGRKLKTAHLLEKGEKERKGERERERAGEGTN